MKNPDDAGQPASVPIDTYELGVGEKIVTGDLKWHNAANGWTEIQTVGYRTVKASQKGLFRRRKARPEAEDPPAQKTEVSRIG